MNPSIKVLLGIGLAVVVAAQAALAWVAWQHQAAAPNLAGNKPGSVLAVTLVSGQVYYGSLAGSDARQLSLDDVYYVQTQVDPATNQRSNRLVSRHKTDWHAPERMSILLDKVLLVESVGGQAQLLRLMEEDRKSSPAARP